MDVNLIFKILETILGLLYTVYRDFFVSNPPPNVPCSNDTSVYINTNKLLGAFFIHVKNAQECM